MYGLRYRKAHHSSSDLNAATAVIHLDPGETVECEFVNAEAKVQIVESFTVSRVEEGKVTGQGSIACYWITLATAPIGGAVTVAVGPPANGEVTLSKSQVTLDAANWNSLTTSERSNFVCIRPVDDKIDESGQQQCWDGNSDIIGNGSLVTDKECGDHTDAIPHRVTSASALGYSTGTPLERKQPDRSFAPAPNGEIPVLIQDNDSAGVILTESYGVSDLDEDGHPVGKACYWVTLETMPTAPVKITPQPDSQVRVNPSDAESERRQLERVGCGEQQDLHLP